MAKKKAVKKGQKKARVLTEKGRAACTSKLKQSAKRSSTQQALPASAKATARSPLSLRQIEVRQALQTTWLLKGCLKNAQLSYLRVGKLLAQVREKKMYEDLGHADIEDYAEKRLQLGRASLYKYLKVYDWVSKNHSEWLQPKPKGFIPELADVAGLIEIEAQLQQKYVFPQKRAKLQALKQKALAGELKDSELNAIKKNSTVKVETLDTFASDLKSLRRKAGKIMGMPAEVIVHIDAALALLNNEKAVAHLDFSSSRDRLLA